MKMTLTILLAIALCLIPLYGNNQTDTSGTTAGSVHDDKAVMPVTVLSSFPSELTVDGLISLARGNYVIQMGAFSRRAQRRNRLKHKLEQMLGLAVDVIGGGEYV